MINFQVGDEVKFEGQWYKVQEIRPSLSEPGRISPKIRGNFKRPSSIKGHRPMVMENI